MCCNYSHSHWPDQTWRCFSPVFATPFDPSKKHGSGDSWKVQRVTFESDLATIPLNKMVGNKQSYIYAICLFSNVVESVPIAYTLAIGLVLLLIMCLVLLCFCLRCSFHFLFSFHFTGLKGLKMEDMIYKHHSPTENWTAVDTISCTSHFGEGTHSVYYPFTNSFTHHFWTYIFNTVNISWQLFWV